MKPTYKAVLNQHRKKMRKTGEEREKRKARNIDR